MSKKRKIEDEQSISSKGEGPPSEKKKKMNTKSTPKKAVPITDIKIASFVEHRSVEIQAMAELVQDIGGNHTAFQKLPNHMRRRAMSHNIKRIPRRLHAVAKLELSKTKAPGKRPSRRHRRRPSNLLSEYERRKRKIGWLETHIWHAKRFKMVEKWGYRLAYHPNDKSIRACYRAVKRHCLLQDVSFEACIEVRGNRQTLLEGLGHITSSESGLTFGAKITAGGARQGQLILYNMDSYPKNTIGPVTYLWQPQHQDKGIERGPIFNTLWISCHPSIYKEVLNELKKCFGSEDLSDCTESILGVKDGTGVTIKSLKDQLVKFRLYGPSSNLVLAETLQIADTEVLSFSPEKVEESKKNKTMWWKNFFSSSDNKKMLVQQSQVWQKIAKCQSPCEAPPNCVIALTVRDPRLMLPPKKNKVQVANAGSVTNVLPMDMFNTDIATSPLWEAWIREELKATKISEQELNRIKSKHLIPGTPLELGDMESRIPIILIQRPGVSSFITSETNPSHSSGWDLIIPSGFAMAFWVALVYRGARVGGIREAKSICLQAGLLSAPDDYPDSVAGQAELKSNSNLQEAKHNRMPPAKRPNFVKLGFLSPFNFEFQKLLTDWHIKWKEINVSKLELKQVNDETVTVLRNRKMLRLLQSAITNPKAFLKKTSKGQTLNNSEEQSVVKTLLSIEIGKKLVSEEISSLIPVRLSILHRGVPATYGHICLPLHDDLKALDNDKTFGGPFEPKHSDPGQAKRKEERKERLRLRKLESKEIINSNSVLGSTSRDIIGFVKDGDFDLVKGQGLGFGFCSVAALLALIENQKDRRICLALVRNPTSLQYRFSSISLLM
ncbi:hypothetical protein EGW08_002117 [Elysia chlorotica]|uniref:Uncharacterized protein n=1 Tax=Elysia chlorotica TaxID=188477 RepID=A0A3S1BW24_ELYCH|nr:hypothetical protein EGW08_002117 [Elysia chlorotica]